MPKLLAVDLDGTLFYPKGRRRLISKKNVEFLRRFIDAGNKVVLITSRQPYFIEKVKKLLQRPVDYLSSMGAVVNVNNNMTKEISIPNRALENILNEIKHEFSPIGYVLSCKNKPLIVAPMIKIGKPLQAFYKFCYKLAFGIYREEISISNEEFDDQIKNGTIYSVKAFFGVSFKSKKINKEINKVIRDKYPMIESSWMGLALEFAPRGCSKGESLLDYVEYIHFDKKDVYVIGDSGNDISMFHEFYENSFVMRHAYPSVKKYAKHRVSRVYKMEKYLFERSTNG